MMGNILQQPMETETPRKLEVVILRDKGDLFALRNGEVIGTDLGYAYRAQEISCIIGFFGQNFGSNVKPRKLRIEDRAFISDGMLYLRKGGYSGDTLTREEETEATRYLESLGLGATRYLESLGLGGTR